MSYWFLVFQIYIAIYYAKLVSMLETNHGKYLFLFIKSVNGILLRNGKAVFYTYNIIIIIIKLIAIFIWFCLKLCIK